MFSKMNKILKYSLLGIVGFGISGAILGYIHSADDSWIWLLGFAAIGITGGVTLGFIIGGRKAAKNLTMFGAIAGVLGGFFVSNSEYDPWLQMTVIGVVIGIVFGIAFAITDTGNGMNDRELFCSECNKKIGKNDNYCPNCGLKFE